jgi:hypothetical protein
MGAAFAHLPGVDGDVGVERVLVGAALLLFGRRTVGHVLASSLARLGRTGI